jgi:adenine-specific DNA-methyltransferase
VNAKTREKYDDCEFLNDENVVQLNDSAHKKALGQYFTPRWVAEAIVEHHFSHLRPGDKVIEPSCGDGRFLMALPDHLDVLGVELDPVQAALARQNSGRRVITGNFLDIDSALLPDEVDAVVGNPPFMADTVAGFLERSHALLREGGTCGFILPAYILQTSSKVMAMAKNWSIQTELMPRNVFPGLSLPITYTVFTKERVRRLHGFFLYREAADVTQMSAATRDILVSSCQQGSVWRQAVRAAFDALGRSTASLSDLYAILSRRPTENPNWMQQVRKVLQSYPEFDSMERGVWSFSAPKMALAA